MDNRLRLAFAAAAFAAAGLGHAQENAELRAAAQRAITTSPEVSARYNAFMAAKDEVDTAAGGFYPRVDLNAEVGRTQDTIKAPTRTPPETQSLGRGQVTLSATQLLWDGWATRNQVRRLSHTKLSRYFGFLDISEQTALEATRAYLDVQRYRRFVSLAEDNYVQHRYVETQVQSRVRAGVARGVDLEQAVARLALAESNLSTEVANLHDVSERYRRIVGEVPPDALGPVQFGAHLPASPDAAVSEAMARSPAIGAAIEGLRAARQQASQTKAEAYQPRIEARLRSGGGRNYDGVLDQTRETNASIVLSWNLFKGGSDQARVRQAASLINQAIDERDRACRDTRQTAAIALNDVGKLRDQIGFLQRNEAAIARARDAYRQQFDIGQRSLLDVLNAENELYTARRVLSGAEHDLSLAQARGLASTGQLVRQLGLTRINEGADAEMLKDWQQDEGVGCPQNSTPVRTAASRQELDERARSLIQATPAQVQAPVAAVATAPPGVAAGAASVAVPLNAPARPLEAGSGGSPVAAPASSSQAPDSGAAQTGGTPPSPALQPTPAELAESRLKDWVASWNAKKFDQHMALYSQDFRPAQPGGRVRWQAQRRRLVDTSGPVNVAITNLVTRTLSPTRVDTRFDQIYTSNNLDSQVRKSLIWQRLGDQWLIVRETSP